jgi:hypothetical protein
VYTNNTLFLLKSGSGFRGPYVEFWVCSTIRFALVFFTFFVFFFSSSSSFSFYSCFVGLQPVPLPIMIFPTSVSTGGTTPCTEKQNIVRFRFLQNNKKNEKCSYCPSRFRTRKLCVLGDACSPLCNVICTPE